MANHKILVVDDERNILKSIDRLLIDEPYEVFLANSGAEGLDVLATEPICLIISDMRMPEMDGVEFLIEAKKICPDSVKMVLSGYSDIEIVMKAVNEGNIWRYITKPWEDNDLKIAIANAIDLFEGEKERKKLFEQVRIKNRELENLNETLAEKVAERTWELEVRGEILNMILEDDPFEKVVNSIIKAIRHLTSEGSVFIYVPFMDFWFTAEGLPVSNDIGRLSATVLENCETSIGDNEIGIPLSKGEIKLGALTIKGHGFDVTNLDEMIVSLHNMASLLTLVLSQEKAVLDAPKLFEAINDLLEETK